MVLSEGTTEKKSPVTPPGIDPGTVRLVAQRLNHYVLHYIENEHNLKIFISRSVKGSKLLYIKWILLSSVTWSCADCLLVTSTFRKLLPPSSGYFLRNFGTKLTCYMASYWTGLQPSYSLSRAPQICSMKYPGCAQAHGDPDYVGIINSVN